MKKRNQMCVPDEVHHYCRPESVVFKLDRVKAEARMKPSWAQRITTEPFLFDEDTHLAEAYQYEVNFHNQLKGRLLTQQAPTQVIRESTVAHWDFLNQRGEPKRKLDKLQGAAGTNHVPAVEDALHSPRRAYFFS